MPRVTGTDYERGTKKLRHIPRKQRDAVLINLISLVNIHGAAAAIKYMRTLDSPGEALERAAEHAASRASARNRLAEFNEGDFDESRAR